MEIVSARELEQRLADGGGLDGVRLQDVDLTGCAELLMDRTDLGGLVVLGGVVQPELARHLADRGALVFPAFPDAPVDPYRSSLYRPEELYADIAHGGYAATPDARAYAWSRRVAGQGDAYAAVLQAMHDTSMIDALDELLAGHAVVGVMGGHAVARGTSGYADAAHLGLRLAQRGLVVATGGGPGAMEAADLGAAAGDASFLEDALEELAAVPSFVPDVGAWVEPALRVRARRPRPEGAPGAPGAPRSVGIPTWFYGHEPPNVFGDGIAKFFSNALREDVLLSHSDRGLIVLPGAAGTVQEIFQAVTPRYYAAAPTGPELDGADPVASHVAPPVPPLVLVGSRHWTREVPAWPLLQSLAAGRPMATAVHLVDDLDEAADIVAVGPSAV